MARIRNIRQRTLSVRNIRNVTRTMETVATVRFKKVYNLAVAGRPYTDRLLAMVNDLASHSSAKKFHHPLMFPKEEIRRNALLVISTDRGLCAGYNASVLRLAMERLGQLLADEHDSLLQVVGKEGADYLRFRGFDINREYTDVGDPPRYDPVARLADMMIESFLAGEIGGFEVAYMRFVSSGTQRPEIAQILPLTEIEPHDELAPVPLEAAPFEPVPSAKQLLADLLPRTARLRVFQCFLDASASEHAMRMAAMRAATDNADEMIHDLRRQYNRLRQSQITTELTEIMGGRAGIV